MQLLRNYKCIGTCNQRLKLSRRIVFGAIKLIVIKTIHIFN
jgi:hypothetical protein